MYHRRPVPFLTAALRPLVSLPGSNEWGGVVEPAPLAGVQRAAPRAEGARETFRIAVPDGHAQRHTVAALEDVALWHERDISHSSVERVVVPDSALMAYYVLRRMTRLLDGLQVFPQRMIDNLNSSYGLVFSQPVLLALVESGLSRDDAYRLVQRNAMAMRMVPIRQTFQKMARLVRDLSRKSGKVVDLTLPLDEKTLMWPGAPQPTAQTVLTVAEHGFYNRFITFVEHSGTHFDAPCHMVEGQASVDRVPASSLIAPVPPGGIIDVEFIVQFLILAHAHQYPDLTENLGNIALLGMAAHHGLIPEDLAAGAQTAYREYRRLQHANRLNDDPKARLPIDLTLQAHINAVVELKQQVFGAR